MDGETLISYETSSLRQGHFGRCCLQENCWMGGLDVVPSRVFRALVELVAAVAALLLQLPLALFPIPKHPPSGRMILEL